MSPENRLSNLSKLHLVPAFAVRDLLLSKLGPDNERASRVRRMRRDQLIEEIDKSEVISEADIEQLYENYRYGRRLSFQIYLLPLNLPAIANPDELQAALIESLEARQEEGVVTAQVGAPEDYESEEPLRNIVICDCEPFNDTLEIRYKYQIIHRFLNQEEEPDFVYQTRYGFIWLDPAEGYLAILSKDERLNAVLLGALSGILQALPIPVKLPKELLDEHFPLERARRFSHLDPQNRVRLSISGDSQALQQYRDEILDRDSRCLRPGALYDEDIAPGITSGLGITSRKGKLYLTKTLSTSVVRRWAHSRLPELVRDLRGWVERNPQSAVRASPIISRLKLSDEGKAYVVKIVEALLQAKREAVASVNLGIPPLALYQALGSNRLNPFVHFECEVCDELCDRCVNCESTNLVLVEDQVQCRDCGTVLTLDGKITLKCINGHLSSAALDEALGFLPKHILEQPIYRVLDKVGVSWQRGKEHFYIEGDTLHHLFAGPDKPTTLVMGDYIEAQIGDSAERVIVGKNISVEDRK